MNNLHITKWAVILTGHPFDLARAERILKDVSYARIVQKNNDGHAGYYLTSSWFNPIQEVDKVRTIADRLIAIINGAVKISYPDSGLITLSGQYLVTYSNGTKGIIQDIMGISCRSEIGEVTILVDGIPQQSPLIIGTELLLLAENHEDVSDALHFFSRADNWFDLYKTYEVISQRIIEKLFPGKTDIKESSTFRQNANYYGRHARRQKKPDKDMSLSDAQAYIRKVLLKWVSERNKAAL